jgi:hypothetical protein
MARKAQKGAFKDFKQSKGKFEVSKMDDLPPKSELKLLLGGAGAGCAAGGIGPKFCHQFLSFELLQFFSSSQLPHLSIVFLLVGSLLHIGFLIAQ